jgi:regulator of nonsense transcripts 3
LTSEDLITPLSDKVKSTSFLDAQNSGHDPVLLGPPSLEFAPYARVPGSRTRKDGRQGTIDQDPEFIAFLESLTNPVAKPTPGESEGEKKEGVDVTTTPLVQFIKDKKANRAKDAASGKSSKHGKGDKDRKAEKVEAKKLLKRPEKETAPAAMTTEKKPAKVEKAAKEAVKAANKQAVGAGTKSAKQSTPSSKEAGAQTAAASVPASGRKRERGDISAAAKILQRDLGLAPSGGRRRGGKTATNTETDVSAKGEASQDSTATTTKSAKQPLGKAVKDSASQKSITPKPDDTPSSTQPPESTSAPTSNGNASTPTAPAAATPKGPKQNKAKQIVTSTATQAFLKHANPSQGVTEPLLGTAFSPFGKVTKVEIDKKKGFGYIDFVEPSGLQKAIAASPVTVGQSQVVVLERKNPALSQPKAKGAAAERPRSPSQAQTPASRGPKATGGRSGGGSRGRGAKPKGNGSAAASKAPVSGEKAEKASSADAASLT